MPKEQDGGNAWRKGYMRKDNPFPTMTEGHARWDQQYMQAMGDYYARDIEAASSAARQGKVDEESVSGNPPTVR